MAVMSLYCNNHRIFLSETSKQIFVGMYLGSGTHWSIIGIYKSQFQLTWPYSTAWLDLDTHDFH